MKRVAAVCVLCATAAIVSAETYWVPAVAHVPGVGTSRWRSDVAILNSCQSDAVVEIRLHTDGEVFAETFTISPAQLQVFPDVVSSLTAGDAAGTLEVRSNVGVTVSSRTYNLAENGTFGQSLDAVVSDDGLDQGAVVYLQQLGEDNTFRTNISALNMSGSDATVTVELFDRNGVEVGSYQMNVPPTEFLQEDRPYRRRFGRNNIVGGYARIVVDSGSGIFPFAAVIDNATGDPTAIVARPAPDCAADIAQQLASIPGLTANERATEHEGYRFFELQYEQPVNHDKADGAVFSQYITLLYRASDAPMVLRTLGYGHNHTDGMAELTDLLKANQLVVEHRFFGSSNPSDAWPLLDIRQAAADHHRIVDAIRPLCSGPWISTGHSKGGMTAVFHRRRYPDDVEATVAYVAPISYGPGDERYVDFVGSVGEPECNQRLHDLQREVLQRRPQMMSLLVSYGANYGYAFTRIGGLDSALESVVMEIAFTFWQYAGETYCSGIPSPGASDTVLFEFVENFVGWWAASNLFFDIYGTYFYQAQSELGYPALATDHIDDLLQFDSVSLEEGLSPAGSNPVFDPSAMPDIAQWLSDEGQRMMFIYGENDPWTAGAFELGNATDSFIFVDPGGTHSARIATLEPGDRNQALEIIHRWTGVEPTAQATVEKEVDLFPPWRPTVSAR